VSIEAVLSRNARAKEFDCEIVSITNGNSSDGASTSLRRSGLRLLLEYRRLPDQLQQTT
jgi:hypothetical protein